VRSTNIFFQYANVSKSLLIVLGTFQFLSLLPAKNDREKYRIAGMERSRNAWSSQLSRLAHTSHRPCTSLDGLPAILTDGDYAQTAQSVRANCPAPSATRFDGRFLTIDISLTSDSVFRSSAHCTAHAVCPCQGLRLNDLLLELCVTCPDLICSASRISLDNSYPPRSSRRLSGKQNFMLTQNRRNELLGSAPSVCARRATHLQRESVGDKMQNLIRRSERWNS
jgi:hypothetical protein